MYSLIVPVYGNEGSIADLLSAIEDINFQLDGRLEAVFVVDGSPDRSYSLLEAALPHCGFHSQLVLLSRNFGSFTAIKVGMAEATGKYFAAMAADLQEPPKLIIEFFRSLENEDVDVVVGVREGRNDPWLDKLFSNTFWFLYRKFVQAEMPPGGVDIFGCNLTVRDHLLSLNESNTTLVGLLFWLGFRRKMIGYERRAREHGKSGWNFSKRVNYLVNSILAFSDLPIWILMIIGFVGLGLSIVMGIAVVVARFMADVVIPGYAATMLVILTFGTLNCFGLGVIGAYVWRIFENTKSRPQGIVLSKNTYTKKLTELAEQKNKAIQ